MLYPPLWLWVAALAITALGAIRSFAHLINCLPTWACILLVGTAVFLLYILAVTSFGSFTIRF